MHAGSLDPTGTASPPFRSFNRQSSDLFGINKLT